MHVSAKGDYAARAVAYLASVYPERASAQVIADSYELPRKFLEAVLADLRRAAIVTATRGADGGYALRSVVRPLVVPDEPDQPRIDFVTRLRHDARLHAVPPAQRRPGQRGRTPLWGKPLAPPRQGGRWPGGLADR